VDDNGVKAMNILRKFVSKIQKDSLKQTINNSFSLTIKVKVKLYLLTNYHTMKTYWESEGTAP
jgi:hypothetical protein